MRSTWITFASSLQYRNQTGGTLGEMAKPKSLHMKKRSCRQSWENAFIRSRKEQEEILSAEGSSEQARVLTGSSADLKTELKRNRELTSRAASSLKGNEDQKKPGQESVEDVDNVSKSDRLYWETATE
ncbi:centromere protein R isoform X2 [Trachinotus anak]|uniref:centromere protein R isoform X2 n=1 Tax=Trachinotus anak TaxID=443729 RepID=UPI0039F245E4